jgi:recombination protein RecT
MSEIVQVKETQVMPYIEIKRNDLIQLIGEPQLKRETSFAIQAVNANNYLATATPQSVAKCVWNIAITGLSLNPVLKLAYITPRKINGVLEALLMPSYQGMTKLITDTGSVKQIAAHVVFKGDVFDLEYGMETKLIHKPKFLTRENKDVTHAYAIALLADGTKQFEVMSVDEIYEIRERSDGYKAFKSGKAQSAIWEDHFGEMCRKTVIKRLCKYLPKSVINEKWEKVMQAVDIDNDDYPASDNQLVYIEKLLTNCSFGEDQKAYILSRVGNSMSKLEAEKFIEDLQLNQLGIRDGVNIPAKQLTATINEIKNAS